jgi:hypothetical protein
MQLINVTIAAKFVQWVLNCIDQEYPHHGAYWFNSDRDIQPPRQRTPAFFGCLDWHSAVHGHWLLVRLCRFFPEAEFQASARQALGQSFTPAKIQGEMAHFQRYPFFECPYGVVWLLQLALELREWQDAQAKVWLQILAPLETQVAQNIRRWLQYLDLPDRTGTHRQTAFALGLAWDWAQVTYHEPLAELIRAKALRFYGNDCAYPLQIEPLAFDFLSPGLAAADLMRRILPAHLFADWLTAFLPQFLTETPGLEAPIQITNPQDYLQSHFQGLYLSRAWMLEGIAASLPVDDPRLATLNATAEMQGQFGLPHVLSDDSDHYASSHWLGTFAVYLLTRRGISDQGASFLL